MQRNDVIGKLKEELVAVRTKSAIETKYLQKVACARGQSFNRAYNATTTHLEQEIWLAKKVAVNCPLKLTHSLHNVCDAVCRNWKSRYARTPKRRTSFAKSRPNSLEKSRFGLPSMTKT